MNTRNFINGSLACQSLGDCSLFELPVFCCEENTKQNERKTKRINIRDLFKKTKKQVN